MSGFNKPVKRPPYLPYIGTTINQVIKSFYKYHGSVVCQKELARLMKHCNGK